MQYSLNRTNPRWHPFPSPPSTTTMEVAQGSPGMLKAVGEGGKEQVVAATTWLFPGNCEWCTPQGLQSYAEKQRRRR